MADPIKHKNGIHRPSDSLPLLGAFQICANNIQSEMDPTAMHQCVEVSNNAVRGAGTIPCNQGKDGPVQITLQDMKDIRAALQGKTVG